MNNPKTILIVDDEPVINSSLKSNLKEAGFRVLATQKGRQDLEVGRKQMLELIVLDITLSCRDGWEICKTLTS